ncbi:MAG: hypothetical protein JST22_03220 [Bacteroidetes bacterium]|nr:hypothetical protein [Bacteroidota bacterium]
MRPSILFICGSINQTSQMHAIAQHLPECDCYFSPYYADGLFIEVIRRIGLTKSTVMGPKLASRCLAYLRTHDLQVDHEGRSRHYDLVVTCSDLVVPRNVRGSKLILVQEGMTDPENLMYHLVRALRLPRYLASTSTTGLSHAYDYFCVASDGYREHFVRKGVSPDTIRVTGIPNFDNCRTFAENDFPHRGYVLVATSDARETFKLENRKRFILDCVAIADGRPMIFKLHPNENVQRATREVQRWAPGARVFATGNTNHMIANCDVLITKYSSVVFVGLALGREVHSYFDIGELRRLAPMQNDGSSGRAIAEVCRCHINDVPVPERFEDLVRTQKHAATGIPQEVVR